MVCAMFPSMPLIVTSIKLENNEGSSRNDYDGAREASSLGSVSESPSMELHSTINIPYPTDRVTGEYKAASQDRLHTMKMCTELPLKTRSDGESYAKLPTTFRSMPLISTPIKSNKSGIQGKYDSVVNCADNCECTETVLGHFTENRKRNLEIDSAVLDKRASSPDLQPLKKICSELEIKTRHDVMAVEEIFNKGNDKEMAPQVTAGGLLMMTAPPASDYLSVNPTAADFILEPSLFKQPASDKENHIFANIASNENGLMENLMCHDGGSSDLRTDMIQEHIKDVEGSANTGQTSGKRLFKKRTKQEREVEASVAILTPDSPYTRSKESFNFAQSYFLKVKDRLEQSAYWDFMQMLDEFDTSCSVADLYMRISTILLPHTDLVDEFLFFLLPEQAMACGRFMDYLLVTKMRNFFRKVEVWFARQPYQMRKVYLCLSQLASQPDVTLEDVRSSVLVLLKSNKLLSDYFLQLLPGQQPPASLSDDWEDLRDMGEVADCGGDDCWETLLVPDSVEDLYGSEHCPCECHRQSSAHCTSCSIKFLNGQVYLQFGKMLRPVKVMFEQSDQFEKLCTPPEPDYHCTRRKRNKMTNLGLTPNKPLLSPKHDSIKSGPATGDGKGEVKTTPKTRSPRSYKAKMGSSQKSRCKGDITLKMAQNEEEPNKTNNYDCRVVEDDFLPLNRMKNDQIEYEILNGSVVRINNQIESGISVLPQLCIERCELANIPTKSISLIKTEISDCDNKVEITLSENKETFNPPLHDLESCSEDEVISSESLISEKLREGIGVESNFLNTESLCETKMDTTEVVIQHNLGLPPENGISADESVVLLEDISTEQIKSDCQLKVEETECNECTPDAPAVVLWTREEDRVILQTFQTDCDTEQTFLKINSVLPYRSIFEIRERFEVLMKLLEQMASSSSQDATRLLQQ